MAAETFNCPACDRIYPFKPILLERTMRCSDCGSVFKVESATRIHLVQRAGSSSPAKQSTTKQYAPNTQRLSSRQEEVRSRLTQRLNQAAQDAIASGRIKETPKRSASTSRIQGGASETAGKGSFQPVMTGGGEEEGHRRYRFQLIAAGVVVVVLLVFGVTLLFHNEVATAAHGLMAPREGERWGPPQRHSLVRERFVVYPAEQPVLGLLGPNVRAGSAIRRTIPADAAERLVAFVNTYVRLPQGVWIRRLDRGAVRQALARLPDSNSWRIRDLPDAVQSSMVEDENLGRHIERMGFDPQMAKTFVPLVRGGESLTTLGRRLRERLLAGEMPIAIDIALVRGREGSLLIDSGAAAYQLVPTAYTMTMVRCSWPPGADGNPPPDYPLQSWGGWHVELEGDGAR